MIRITLITFAVIVSVICGPVMASAQELREVQQPRDLVGKILPTSPEQRRLRVPDQFFRHDQARDALRSGNILSLSVIRKTVSAKYPGRIVDVRLLVPKRKGMNYLYDVKVLTNSGKLLSVKVDAKNAKIVDVKG